MKKFKVVKQRDASDCGVCCMQSIILSYGGYIDIERLREETLTDSNGVTAFHMIKALKKYNFDAIGIYTKEYESKEIKLPFIAHVKLKNNLFHYVVVYDIRKDYLTIMDPSEGRVVISKIDFAEIFTGNIINLTPKEKIVALEKKQTLLGLFKNISTRNKSIIIKIITLSLIISLLTIILSYFFKFANNLVINRARNDLYFLIIIFFCLTVFKISLDFIKNNLINNLNLRVDCKLYREFLTHILHLPLSVIKRRTTGEIVTRISEIKEVKGLITEIFFTIFLDLLLALFALVALWIISSKLFLILLLLIIIYLLVGLSLSNLIYKRINQNIMYETEFNTSIIESIDLIPSIKNLNLTNNTVEKENNETEKYLFNTYEFGKFFNKVILFKNITLEIGFFLINAVGFILTFKGELNLVNLITFNMLITYALTPLLELVDILPKFNYVKASFSKISEFLDIEEEVLTPSSEHKIGGKIDIIDVSYSYNSIDNILENKNIKINKGDHVFMSGQSGGGKSTLCSMIYGYLSPTKGTIKIDDRDIRDYNLNNIRSDILYVSQKENLFMGTIRENILMTRTRSLKDFYQVCEICELESIVRKKPLRYESLIDPNSNNLSGGEKQRIILARGLLKNSNVLILDEALSEVDSLLEQKIIKNIRKAYKNKTIIYISHKNQSKLFDYEVKI